MDKIRAAAESLAKTYSNKIILDLEMIGTQEPELYQSFRESLPAKVVGIGVHEKNIFWILDGDFFLWFSTNSTATWREDPGKHAKVKICLNDAILHYNKKGVSSGLELINGRKKMLERLRS